MAKFLSTVKPLPRETYDKGSTLVLSVPMTAFVDWWDAEIDVGTLFAGEVDPRA